jgi:hypothetical protein
METAKSGIVRLGTTIALSLRAPAAPIIRSTRAVVVKSEFSSAKG